MKIILHGSGEMKQLSVLFAFILITSVLIGFVDASSMTFDANQTTNLCPGERKPLSLGRG